jgi:hypothetical protein
MLRSLALSGFLALAVAAPLRAADDCAQAQFEQASLHVKQVQMQLLADKVEEMDENVPSLTQRQIRAMKDALSTAVDLYVGCQQGGDVDVKALEARLAELMGTNKPELATPADRPDVGEQVQQIYGADLKLAAKRPDATKRLIGVEVSFGVMCGEDTMLLLYEWRDDKWRKVLRWQSGDYDQVSGAFGDFFEYVVMPRSASEEWAVAVAHGMPWCTSGWSAFDLDVIETGHGTGPQKLIFHKNAGYYRATDNPPALKAVSDNFDLRLQDMSVDFDHLFLVTEIYRYRLAGGDVRRVQPVAMNGRDFVDVWLSTDWDDAVDWSATGNIDNLKDEHALIDRLRKPEKVGSAATISFGAVRGCSDDPKRFQVELDLDPGAPVYFAIREGENSFTMLSASNRPDPHCNSANLVPTP